MLMCTTTPLREGKDRRCCVTNTLQSSCLWPFFPIMCHCFPIALQEKLPEGSRIFPFLDCGHTCCMKLPFLLGKIPCTDQGQHNLRYAVICQEQTHQFSFIKLWNYPLQRGDKSLKTCQDIRQGNVNNDTKQHLFLIRFCSLIFGKMVINQQGQS